MTESSIDPAIMQRLKQSAPEICYSQSHTVSCDGGGGALGHPRVYYTIGTQGFVECGYCDRAFVLDAARDGRCESTGE